MKLRLILFFVFIVLAAKSQTFLGATMLKSIPVAEFGEKSLSEDAGFAMPGVSLGLEVNHFFNDYLGYGLCFDAGNNPVDVHAWEKLLMEDGVEDPSIGSFDYETFAFLGSFNAKLELIENTEVHAGVNLGFLNVKFPARSYTSKSIDSLYNGTLFSEGGEGAGFSYGAEIGASYQIGKIKIQAFCDYIKSTPKFNYFDYYSYKYRYYSLKVSMLRPGFQVFYKF